jgi:hypothetical protein
MARGSRIGGMDQRRTCALQASVAVPIGALKYLVQLRRIRLRRSEGRRAPALALAAVLGAPVWVRAVGPIIARLRLGLRLRLRQPKPAGLVARHATAASTAAVLRAQL